MILALILDALGKSLLVYTMRIWATFLKFWRPKLKIWKTGEMCDSSLVSDLDLNLPLDGSCVRGAKLWAESWGLRYSHVCHKWDFGLIDVLHSPSIPIRQVCTASVSFRESRRFNTLCKASTSTDQSSCKVRFPWIATNPIGVTLRDILCRSITLGCRSLTYEEYNGPLQMTGEQKKRFVNVLKNLKVSLHDAEPQAEILILNI